MTGLTCGIDIGSTNLKVLLLDDQGRTAWIKSMATPKQHDGLGPVTDARHLLEALEQLIIEGWRAVGKGRPLAAIATGGIGEDGVGVDDNLQPLGLALSWFDKRGEADSAAIGRLPAASRYPGIRFEYCTTAGKWRWLNRERPHELRGARHWITISDYPAAYWSGAPFISETLAARTGCFDVFARNWIPELLAASGAPPLPPLLKAGEIIGTMRAGPLTVAGAASAETLLVAGGHDHPMASSAIRRIAPLARVDSLGTANATYGETAAPKPGTAESGLDLSVPAAGGPGVALIGAYEFTASLNKAVPDGSTIQSFLARHPLPGNAAPQPAEDAGSDGDRIRHVLELAAWRARSYFEAMARAGVSAAPIYATGGWAKSRGLVELRASMFGEAVTVVDEPELAALGVALFAAEAVYGIAPDFARHHDHQVIEPRKDWQNIYAGWES
jgi:xylulokinase